MKTEIYLIRHAQKIQDEIDYKVKEDSQLMNEKLVLSVKGEKQAFELSKLQELQNIDLVISSNYVRTISTAKYIVENNKCKFIVDNNLGERKLGTEYRPKEFWLEQMKDENAKTIDGESQKEVRSRLLKVINNLLEDYKGKRIAVITHAAAMTFLLMHWCSLESVELDGKKRKLVFNNKVIIDGSFNTPEVFKLYFNDSTLVSIERIQIKENVD